jgi:predicted Ser/Thr protein kinase
MASLAAGSVFAGYRLEEMAGRGGMGVVYRARQLRPDRLVALKVITPDYAQDPIFRQRFESESEVAASLEHPNVIPVYEVNEVDGLLFIAMRFVDGHDLHSLIRSGLDPQSAVRIIDQVAGALDAAHAAGLVHRDIKPGNVLVADVGGRWHAYLTDFGLAQRVDGSAGLTRTGTFMGTPDYAAPEQIRGERVDARTDVYALTCVLYESLTREVPYPRDSAPAAMYAHLDAPPPSVTEHVAGLPPATNEVIRRGMAKNPDDRYPSAGDLGRAAVAALEERPVTERERTVAAGQAAPNAETIIDEPALAPPPAETPPARSSRRAVLIGVPLAIAAVVAVAAVVALDGDGGGGDGGTPTPAAAGPQETWSADVGGYPLYTAVAGEHAWVVLDGADRLKRVSLDGRSVTDTADIGELLGGLAVTDDRLLVGAFGEDGNDGRGTVLTVDPATGEASGPPIRTIDPFELATDGRTLWVTDLGQIDVIDLATRRRARRFDLEGGFDVALRDGTAWVVDNARGELLAFEAETGERRGRAVDVGAVPVSVAATADAIWVATEQGQLLRVPPDGGRPESLAVGGEGNRVVEADAGGVWVVDDKGTVVLVDPERLQVRGRLQLGGSLQDVALDGGDAFVVSSRSTEASTLVRVSSGSGAQ